MRLNMRPNMCLAMKIVWGYALQGSAAEATAKLNVTKIAKRKKLLVLPKFISILILKPHFLFYLEFNFNYFLGLILNCCMIVLQRSCTSKSSTDNNGGIKGKISALMHGGSMRELYHCIEIEFMWGEFMMINPPFYTIIWFYL